MTQDEVDLIYDHLHENYEYRDGELIRIKVCKNRKIGESLGSVNLSRRHGRLKIQCNISVNKKTYSMQLGHLIYLYHFKKKANYLRHLDQNPMNCKIENLLPCSLSQTHHPKNYNKNKKGYREIKIDGEILYRPSYQPRKKYMIFDAYHTKEDAQLAYFYAKELHSTTDLSIEEIYEETHKRYPGIAPKRRPHKELPKGVYKNINTYYSKIMKNGKVAHLGKYNTPEEARAAYLKAKAEHAKS